MAQIYKIFVNEIPVTIQEGNPSDVEKAEDPHRPVFFFTEQEKIRKAFSLVESGNYYRSLTIIAEDAKEIRKALFANYKMVEAAGGVVYNLNKEMLLIFRHGMWDLPKGKLELGESVKAAAMREVTEETGIAELVMLKKLRKTFHTYVTGDRQKVLKKTHWYLMEYTGKGKLKPQAEEGIDMAIWVPADNLEQKMANTYGNIRDVVDAGLIALHLS